MGVPRNNGPADDLLSAVETGSRTFAGKSMASECSIPLIRRAAGLLEVRLRLLASDCRFMREAVPLPGTNEPSFRLHRPSTRGLFCSPSYGASNLPEGKGWYVEAFGCSRRPGAGPVGSSAIEGRRRTAVGRDSARSGRSGHLRVVSGLRSTVVGGSMTRDDRRPEGRRSSMRSAWADQ